MPTDHIREQNVDFYIAIWVATHFSKNPIDVDRIVHAKFLSPYPGSLQIAKLISRKTTIQYSNIVLTFYLRSPLGTYAMSQSRYFRNKHHKVNSICDRLFFLVSNQATGMLLSCQTVY